MTREATVEKGSLRALGRLAGPYWSCERRRKVRGATLLLFLLTEASRSEEALVALELALARPERYYPALVRAAQIEIALGRFEAAAAPFHVALQPGKDRYAAGADDAGAGKGRQDHDEQNRPETEIRPGLDQKGNLDKRKSQKY